ncbi:MAG TPA: NUMOD1 domain-containing DNA-binding protein [Puia sp.]|nr:NUMOD1 domain-containing DNA-binding protein [Puia sp.]
MKFISPEFKKNEIIAGVYKITIDDSWFYIGSSVNLKARISKWTSSLKNRKHFKNKNISYILNDYSVVKFEFLYCINILKDIRDIENKLLKENISNKFFLNRCPNAENPRGLKPFIWKEKKIKKVFYPTKIPVVQYNINHEFIQRFESIGEASRVLKIPNVNIRKVIHGKQRKTRGFIFEKEK